MTPTPEQFEAAKKMLDDLRNPSSMTREDQVAQFLAARDADKDEQIAELRKESDRRMELYSEALKKADKQFARAEQAEAAIQHVLQKSGEKITSLEAVLAESKRETEYTEQSLKRVSAELAAMTKERDIEKGWKEAFMLELEDWIENVEVYRDNRDAQKLIDLRLELAALKAPVSDEDERELLSCLEDSIQDHQNQYKYSTKTVDEICKAIARLLRQRTAALKEAEDRLKLCDDGTPDARDKFRKLFQDQLDSSWAKIAALEKK